MDKAGKEYWDKSWQDALPAKALNPKEDRIANLMVLKYHELFSQLFKTRENHDKKLLEIGCANSLWLPYFSKEFDFKVYGIDYSEIGCEKSRRVLAAQEVDGEIVCSDFFNAPGHLYNYFDVVVSFGVVEHYKKTSECIKALSKYLKPNGLIITIIPNLTGVNGVLQRIINREIYDIHVPLNKLDLEQAHRNAGLEVKVCDYFMFSNLGVLNFSKNRNNLSNRASKILRGFTTKVLWAIEYAFPKLKANRITSPYVNCVAKNTKKTD